MTPTRAPQKASLPPIYIYPTGEPTGVPSIQPSGQPTSIPTSSAPSTTPTSIPTILPPDPLHFYYQLHPEIYTIAGTGYNTNPFNSITSKATWSNPLGLLMGNPPGSSVQLGLKISGRPVAQHSIPTKMFPISSISLVVKTPTIYPDRRSVTVAYQVRDQFGHSQVFIQQLPSGSPIIMVVSSNTTYAQSVIPCNLPDPVSGIGICTGYLAKSWFSVDSESLVDASVFTSVRGVGTITSSAHVMTLKKQVVFIPKPLTVDAFYVMPVGHVSMGEYVDIPVRCNVYGDTVYNWNITMTYKKTALKYIAFTGSPLFRSVFFTKYDDADGIHSHLLLSTLGVQPFVNTSLLAGMNVDLFAVRFLALQKEGMGDDPVTHPGAVSVFVNYMISHMLQYILYEDPGSKMDNHGYEFRPAVGGELLVLPTRYTGIMAYTTNSELINTAAITGEAIYSKITVLGVVESGSLLDHDVVTSSSECSTDYQYSQALSIVNLNPNATVFSNGTTVRRRRAMRRLLNSNGDGATNCMVEVNRLHAEGSPEAAVTVAYRYNTTRVLSTTVPMRVWYPALVNVYVRDPILNRII